MNLWRVLVDPDTGRAISEPQSVTTPAGYVGMARLAANGRNLVYEARETTSNIYRAPFDVEHLTIGRPEPVTTGSRTFRFVDPSPDGRLVVLGTSFLQQEDLFIGKPDGSELRQLTTDMFNDRWPEWSPNGDVIAFYSDRTGKYEIWTATPAGQLKQITNAPDLSLLYPRWSPTGRWMTATDVSSGRGTVIFDPNKPWQEQTPDRLPPPAGPGTTFTQRVVWSPDEKEIAGPVANAVYVYNIASRQHRQIPNARGLPLAWLRDGRIVIATPSLVNVIDPQTGNARPVVMPDLHGLTGVEIRLSRDEKTAFLSLAVNEADVWMVTLGTK
jgi:hypothetical protein